MVDSKAKGRSPKRRKERSEMGERILLVKMRSAKGIRARSQARGISPDSAAVTERAVKMVKKRKSAKRRMRGQTAKDSGEAGRNFRESARKAKLKKSSERISAEPIFLWHFLQRPFKKSQEKMGMLSYHFSWCLHFGQMERLDFTGFK